MVTASKNSPHLPQRSIRLRLQLWFGVLLAGLLVGFGIAVYQLQKIATMTRVDTDLDQRADLVGIAFRGANMRELSHPRDEAGKPPSLLEDPSKPLPAPGARRPPERPYRRPVSLSSSVTNLFVATNVYFYAVWGKENILLAQSAPNARDIPKPQAEGWETRIQHRSRGTWRDAYYFTEMRDCVLVGRDIASDLAGLHLYAWGLAAIGGLILALGLGGGFLFSGLLLRSIHHISDTALRISEGNLSERIPTDDMDCELGQLADVLNATFARLDAAFARQQQFTADAAHELRTPLAVIISDAQTALRRERSPEEYRDTIRACEEAAQDMRRLAESLLELARMDAGGGQEPPTPVDLARLLREHVERIRPLAALRDIQIHLDLAPATVPGHPEQMGRVFTNLLSNAIDYNTPGGSVRVAMRTDPRWAVVTVEDTGTGIDPEDLPHIFDRFYRTSRTRPVADGHSGLGLAICKSILDAHGGQIEASSQPGQGTVFTLRWPWGSRPA